MISLPTNNLRVRPATIDETHAIEMIVSNLGEDKVADVLWSKCLRWSSAFASLLYRGPARAMATDRRGAPGEELEQPKQPKRP